MRPPDDRYLAHAFMAQQHAYTDGTIGDGRAPDLSRDLAEAYARNAPLIG